MSVEGTGLERSGSEEAMTNHSNGTKKRARQLMAAHPGLKYAHAVRLTRTNITLGYEPSPPYTDVNVNPFGNVALVGSWETDEVLLKLQIMRDALAPERAWDVAVMTSKKNFRLSPAYNELTKAGAHVSGDPLATLAELTPGTALAPKLVVFDGDITDLFSHEVESVMGEGWFTNLMALMADPHTAVISRSRLPNSVRAGVVAAQVVDNSDVVAVFGQQSRSATHRYLGVDGLDPMASWRVLDADAGTLNTRLRRRGALLVKSTGRRAGFVVKELGRDSHRFHPMLPLGEDHEGTILRVDASRNILVTGLSGTGGTVTCDVLARSALDRGWRVEAVLELWFHHDPLCVNLADTHWVDGAPVTRFGEGPAGVMRVDEKTGRRVVVWRDDEGEHVSEALHEWVASTSEHYAVTCGDDGSGSVRSVEERMVRAIMALTPGTASAPKLIVVDDPSTLLHDSLPSPLRGALVHLVALAADPNTALVMRAITPDELPQSLVQALGVRVSMGQPHRDHEAFEYRTDVRGVAFVEGDTSGPHRVPLRGFMADE